ncbi:MAG: RluA family pseudouridine synthase [Oscillospiraceae bacterium]|nr:RluA family pseudouridine synthase [Oscillospiraceae bacterium]
MILRHIAARNGRLSALLRSDMRLSHTLVNRLKVQNAIFVNGNPVHTDYPVAAGDEISVLIEEATPEYPAEAGRLDILFEDEAVIAIDKPVGILVHPSRSRFSGTLANFLTHYYQSTGQKCAVHPVSRLDRDTFGVVLLAKNAYTHAKLCDAHAEGTIEKTYLAAVWGAPPEDEGIIDLPIIRISPIGMLRAVGEGGQRAVTEYRVLRREAHASLLELHPKTGRTHQLRVHLSHIGCPILGDPQYCTDGSRDYSLSHGLTYQQLCAAALRYPHPLTGETMELRSAQSVILPED